jgi:enolase
MICYKNKYLKYKYKYKKLKYGGNYDKDDSKCDFRKFPNWIIKMSKNYPETVDYSLFTVLPESIYSSELPFHIQTWVELLKKEEILDLTSNKEVWALNMTTNIGAFDINIVKNYKNLHIDAVELDKCTYEALVKNVKEFNMTDNIHPIHKDALEYIKNITKQYDFVYIDPPWSGPDYKKEEKLKLKLSNIDIHDIIDDVFDKNITNIICLKAPTNFEFKYENKYKVTNYSFLTPNKRVSYNVFVIQKK